MPMQTRRSSSKPRYPGTPPSSKDRSKEIKKEKDKDKEKTKEKDKEKDKDKDCDTKIAELVKSLIAKRNKLLQLRQQLNEIKSKDQNEAANNSSNVKETVRTTRRRSELQKKRQCSAKMYSPVRNNKNRKVFEKPFATDKEFKVVVKKPVSLTEIADNIENDRYNSPTELRRDLLLVFQNATMFYGYDHPIHKAAVEFRNEIWPHLFSAQAD